ncbi:maturation protein [ssRNA phage Gerhypos.4_4]|uniref:Maturation protein n=2 Tax=Leviviricetes TaxID=2842243 RepID=A0A8S5KZF3_9VIRU|nr:maturation protein [ssRNA phage Gerhypos.4_4]QDH88971.1 MAG: hypothetical protein H4Bulk46292_000001 [Leviviridae sp.]DAD50559.1 TPA_asm: maturation protein [ssRNA phage Gerhypos.4_4]
MGRIRNRLDPQGLSTYVASVSKWKRPRNPTTGVQSSGPVSFDSWQTEPAWWQPTTSQMSSQVTADENHALHDASALRGAPGDVGGPFDMVRKGIRSKATAVELATRWSFDNSGDSFGKQYRYNGPVFATDPTLLTAGSSNLRATEVALRGQGTTAIARCKPTNHISNLANDMTEIYHGQLPKLPGRHLWKPKIRRAKVAGDEYLNVVFGWLPLVSDLHDAMYAAANSERLMKTYEENSGKSVRRRYEFPLEETSSTVDAGNSDGHIGIFGNWNVPFYLGFLDSSMSQPHLLITTKTSRRVWFSGAFTYFLPVTYKSRRGIGRIAAEAAHLYGLELTPEVLWEVTPWTWAIDWFSNAGDVISNLSSWQTDGLVMTHGYLMEHVVREVTYALDRPSRWKLSNGGTAHAEPVTVYYESKRRIKASPFGFDSDFSGLSLRQLAIAFALGITKWLR